MEEGDRTISTKDEPIDETDQEKMLRETTSLLRESENCMYTIQVAPGITMHINISPESDMESDGNALSRGPPSWCISTLIVHNGQHYVNTIHNFIVSPELIRDLGLVREPSVNMLQQLLMNPLELPRNSLTALAPRDPSDGRINSPMAIYRMVEHYCRYVMRTARILDNVFGWVMPDHNSDLPALLQDIRDTSQTLHSMLERVHNSIQVAENQFGHFEFTLKEEEEEEELQEPEQTKTDEDANTDSDDELEPEAESHNCDASDFVGFDDYDDSQTKCDDDSSTSESDMRSSIFLGPTFEEIPQQFWSLSSSDDENEEEQGDDDSWESDFGDDDSFDAYMVRQLRAHASGLTTRLNTDWGSLPNEPVQPDDDEWDIGSCGTSYEIDDLHSELSYSSEDLNAWQYNEDRTFETDLSRPLRRLVGDLPPLTAQEERYTWLPPYDDFDYRSSQRTSRDYHELPDESLPLAIYSAWDLPDNMPTSSGSSQSDSQSRNQDTDPYSFSFYSNAIDNLSSSLHDIDLDELIHMRETTPEPNSDSDMDGLNIDLENDPFYPTHDQLTIPLQSFIQQTDELIAQIWASF